MRRVIEVSRVKQYGRVEYQPECESAKGFARLLKQKHLTIEDIERIKELGYCVTLKGGEL